MMDSTAHFSDQTVTRTIRADGDTPVTMGVPEVRSTRCVLVRRETEIDTSICDVTPDKDMDPPRVDTDWCHTALRRIDGSLAAEITAISGRRRYSNSDGVSFDSQSIWYQATVRGRSRQSSSPDITHITDGSAVASELPAMLSELTREAADRLASEVRTLPARSRVPFVLAPAAAAVFLHEMVGHVAEELSAGQDPLRLGPPELQVTAYHPRQGGFDDDGSPAARRPIVRQGRLAPLPPRAGLSQAAWHRGPPSTRCTHLSVEPAEPVAALMERAIGGLLITGVSGAELVGRHAVLRICMASWLGARHPRRVPPFLLRVDLTTVADMLVGIGDDVRDTRAAFCTKGTQSLVTQVRTPSLLLAEATVDAS